MKKSWDLKKVLSNLEAEGQGRGFIMGVTRLLLLGPFMYWNQQTSDYSIHHCTVPLDSLLLNQSLHSFLSSILFLNNYCTKYIQTCPLIQVYHLVSIIWTLPDLFKFLTYPNTDIEVGSKLKTEIISVPLIFIIIVNMSDLIIV